MTRLNVYAGPAGFYIVRGGPGDGSSTRDRPQGRAPRAGARRRRPAQQAYYEIPIAIQDRSFNADGSLFYPDSRGFFDGITGPTTSRTTDVSPIWNPEFFGNTMVVNGRTWPYLDVERRRYRFRFLNGSQSRFLILNFNDPERRRLADRHRGRLPAGPGRPHRDHGRCSCSGRPSAPT